MQIPWPFPSHAVKKVPLSSMLLGEVSGPQAAVHVAHGEHTPLSTCGMAQDAFGSSQTLSSDPSLTRLLFPFAISGPGSHIREVAVDI